MLVSILFIIGEVTYIIWVYQLSKECTRQLVVINAMCDAGEAFWDWRNRNQGVYIGLSPEGRKLLVQYLDAYDELLRMRNSTNRSRYEFLENLLNDFPPKEPNGMPPGVPKKPCDNIKGLFSLVKQIVSPFRQQSCRSILSDSNRKLSFQK